MDARVKIVHSPPVHLLPLLLYSNTIERLVNGGGRWWNFRRLLKNKKKRKDSPLLLLFSLLFQLRTEREREENAGDRLSVSGGKCHRSRTCTFQVKYPLEYPPAGVAGPRLSRLLSMVSRWGPIKQFPLLLLLLLILIIRTTKECVQSGERGERELYKVCALGTGKEGATRVNTAVAQIEHSHSTLKEEEEEEGNRLTFV